MLREKAKRIVKSYIENDAILYKVYKPVKQDGVIFIIIYTYSKSRKTCVDMINISTLDLSQKA
jgi:hypothetical protein